MASIHNHPLWAPVRRDISQLKEEIADLSHQYNELLLDPMRVTDDSLDRFVYKVCLNHWYHVSMPATKKRIVERIETYWTETCAGKEWMEHFQATWTGAPAERRLALDECMKGDIAKFDALLLQINKMYVDMCDLMFLNPTGKGAEEEQFFSADGPIVRLEGMDLTKL